MPLADVGGLISLLAKLSRKGHQSVADDVDAQLVVVEDPMRVWIKSRQKTGPTRRAQRGSHKEIIEGSAFLGNAVDVGRFQNRMSGMTELVPALVVRDDKHDVGSRVSRMDQANKTVETQ